jgi:hypothetical protein
MKKYIVGFFVAVAVLFGGLAAVFHWAFNEGDLTDPDVVSERILKQAERQFPSDVAPKDLIGQVVVYTRVKERGRKEYFPIPYVSDPYRFYEVQNPGGIRSDERYFPQGESCTAFHGGEFAAKGTFQESVIVQYTSPDVLPRMEMFSPFAIEDSGYYKKLRENQCPTGTLLLMGAQEYQSLRREWYLRKHHDPLVARLRREKEEQHQRDLNDAVKRVVGNQ